ncbi:hypothetical protein [Glaciihabitans sp. UYNi722]|uniref:hypothetical protein n=1 Tax=Glaciihabitans sp. UYNi722 TaxID=3156344 RepID=UPI0033955303
MSYIAHRVVRQHGFVVALVSAAAVLAVLTVQALLNFLVSQLSYIGAGPGYQLQWWAAYGGQFVAVALPFAIGILLSFWFIAPLAGELHIAHVVTRSILAAAIGAVLVFLLVTAVSFVGLISGGLMSNLLAIAPSGENMLRVFGSAVNSAAQQFISGTPLVILVGVLLWIWFDKHPSKHPVSGIVDQA